MALSRSMTPFEKWFHGMECFVQVGFDISEPWYITKMIDRLGDAVPGLHLRSDGKTLFQTNDPFVVEEIPKGLSARDAAQWLVKNRQPKQSDRLAVIGANRDKLVLSMSHMCGDGGYLIHIINKVCSDDIKPTGWSLRSVEEMFSEKMKMHGASAKALQVDDSASRLYPTSKLPVDHKKWVTHREMIFPAKDLMCYDKATGKLHGLTETLWTGLILSSFAFNGKIGPIGCATCLNMRSYLPAGQAGFNTGNCYSSITVGAPAVKKTTTIAEIAQAMRSDLKTKLGKGMHYEYFNAMLRDWNLPGIGGAACEVSNVGQIHINDPIKNVYVTASTPDNGCLDVITAMSYSVISKHSNNVAVQLTHAPSIVTNREFRQLQASLKHFVTKVPFNANVYETVSVLRRVQESTQ